VGGGICQRLNESDTSFFVPVLSKAALVSYSNLKPKSKLDNLLMEQLLALELQNRDNSFLICPVFAG